MRICFIAPAGNYHTVKWCDWFASRGHEVHVISFIDAPMANARVHFIDAGVSVEDGDSKKLKYLLHGREVRRLVREIRPDVVNAHYATSYGAVAALSGVRGYVLSVWGSDVYDFPRKSPLHRALLKFSLARAGHLFSTSRAMAEETRLYTRKPIDITPFGVDMARFNPEKREDGHAGFVIGTVKTLSPKYGIDVLLRAAALIRRTRPDIPLKLRIAGKGPGEREYRALARELGLDGITTWLGFITQDEAAREWACMDVAVVPSVLKSESFGVSAVEAQACGTAVVISDIPGLMEATSPGSSSVVVPAGDARALAEAVAGLYDHPERRAALGREGRRFASETYDLNRCFERIEGLFERYGR